MRPCAVLVAACILGAGCAGTSPRGPASGAASRAILLNVPFFPDKTDQCGPSTLASVLAFWGKAADPAQLRSEMYLAKLHGTLPMDMLLAAQDHGLKAAMIRGTLEALRREVTAGRPVIAMLNQGLVVVPIDHYVVVTGFDDTRGGVLAHSAGYQNKFISYRTFLGQWEKTDYWTLVAGLPS